MRSARGGRADGATLAVAVERRRGWAGRFAPDGAGRPPRAADTAGRADGRAAAPRDAPPRDDAARDDAARDDAGPDAVDRAGPVRRAEDGVAGFRAPDVPALPVASDVGVPPDAPRFDAAAFDESFVEAPFVEAPFVEAPFVEAPFGEAPFGEAPFGEAPFGEAPFGEAPFVEAPFVEAALFGAAFVEAPFVEAALFGAAFDVDPDPRPAPSRPALVSFAAPRPARFGSSLPRAEPEAWADDGRASEPRAEPEGRAGRREEAMGRLCRFAGPLYRHYLRRAVCRIRETTKCASTLRFCPNLAGLMGRIAG
ncbi:hypothetical protein ACO229_25235 [Promicromonospora sp. MS192]|uniref:hypothetical protein n=1 Tax=Promicromonospora sp. MS192 TaxID=3412684 RepID=UPI003C2F4F3D